MNDILKPLPIEEIKFIEEEVDYVCKCGVINFICGKMFFDQKKFLLKFVSKYDINQVISIKNGINWTILMYICDKTIFVSIVDFLIELGAKVPCIFEVVNFNIDIFKRLLTYYPISELNVVNKKGFTVLHSFIYCEHNMTDLKWAKIILNNDIDVDIKNNDGQHCFVSLLKSKVVDLKKIYDCDREYYDHGYLKEYYELFNDVCIRILGKIRNLNDVGDVEELGKLLSKHEYVSYEVCDFFLGMCVGKDVNLSIMMESLDSKRKCRYVGYGLKRKMLEKHEKKRNEWYEEKNLVCIVC